ncbi:FtsK/SpoIIIE domain-containing protein [Thiolapillus sp.]|uniref:FtsK/SpoIIIE domain-containing protein n=1 Tax=Thiolapillus sp. TaxID=2017437 RepID=UPI003AF971DA
MTRNELIAAVALEFIKEQLAQEKEGTQRFCMLGLEESIVRSIAEAAILDPGTNNEVLVQISPIFDPDQQLPQSNRSNQSITHWRHCRLTEGKRAVLFAASHEELQRNDKSVEKITKIESDTLRGQYSYWIEKVGLTHAVLDKTKRTHLEAALRAANETHAARTIETFSDFVIAIGESIITKGLPLQKAIDNALPSLRLPRFSGFFDRIPDKKRNSKAEWAKIFRRLHTRVRPLLVQENEKGDPISDQLRNNFAEIQDRLDDSDKEVIQDFLDSDPTLDNWSIEQAMLVCLDWRTISDLFEGVTKTSVQSLGDKTIQFFDEEFDDQLDDDERSLLAASFPKEPSEDLQQFFESHREHLARDKKLSSKWERYIFRNPLTYYDFLVGLLGTIHKLRDRTSGEELSNNKIKVHIPKSREKSFWRSKNARVARYFAFRYRGLNRLLGDDVELDFGKLEDFYFPYPDDDLVKVTSRSRDARTIKFEVSLDPNGLNARLIFFWEMPVDALATSMPDDLVNIANLNNDYALLPTADITRQSVSAKGAIQRISLDDVNTIRDVTNGNDGKLVAPNSDSADRGSAFLSALDELSGIIGQNDTSAIRSAFDEFLGQYSTAIRHWVTQEGEGLNSEAFLQQAEAYGRLLEALNNHASNDLARDRLWKEILRLGVSVVGAGSPAAIIAPWHPLRLAEIQVKAKQATDLIKKVLHANEDDIFRADLLFGQVQRELLSNYYPEVCVGFYGDDAILLAAADTRYDYTLCEPPQKQTHSNGDDSLDIDPGVAARAFSTVGEQYLSLLPHERSNFSVVLYNAESKALPSALASELSSKVERENELQCDLLLTHSDPKKMRRIYEQQNVAVSEESGSVMASEAARSFLSRLRVGFLDANEIPEDTIARTADIVALQDVVARNSKLEWKKSPGDRHPELKDHCPARWSRRRPVGPADAATSVYLAAPSQPRAGQIYLNSIHVYLEGDNARPGNVIPAREVTFRNSEIGDVFRQTHLIGEWVVNFDELVDRRLLSNNGIQVIRHIHDRNINRNITVSTTSKPRLLHVLLRERLNRLDPNIIANNGDSVVNRLIDEANRLSGQVVMRAARYGHYANELLGIVLSMEELRTSLDGRSLPIGWYFLDDFASWFGQREEQIADIMAITPRIEDGKPILMVAISEAKYVNSKDYKAQAKKSAKQLEETAARLGRALDPNHKRIDRDIWLHRLGDFMIEGMEPFDGSLMNGWDLHKWSDEVRQGNVTIKLAGFSHVFVHDDDEYVDAGGSTPLKGMPHCVQKIFDKPGVAQAFRDFAAGEDMNTGTAGGSSDTWTHALVSSQNEAQAVDVPTNDTQPPQGVLTERQAEKAEEQPTIAKTTATPPTSEEQNEKPVDKPSAESGVEHAANEIEAQWPSHALAEWIAQGRASDTEDEEAKQWLDQTVLALQRALRGYDMTAELVGKRLTPNAALVRFRGSDDLTVPKVERRRQELLTSHAINVINVLAAPMEVVIMVGRPHRTILRLQDLWRQRELPATAPDINTSLLLGACESDGSLLYLNVGEGFGGYHPHGPHTLIAGETGSGKGVLVQNLLLDICATNSPSSARIRMIDPKAGWDRFSMA